MTKLKLTCSHDPAIAPDRRSRRAATIVAAARALFLEHGYEAVSMTAIVARSGGSLATLYELFGSKQGLLGAVLSAERFEQFDRLHAIVARNRSPFDTLVAAACEMLETGLQPDVVALIRLAIAEALKSPEFAVHLYGVATMPLIDVFHALFERWNETGAATITAPRMAAMSFVSLFFQAPHMRALFCSADSHDRDERTNMVRYNVTMFLTGVGAPCPAAKPAP